MRRWLAGAGAGGARPGRPAAPAGLEARVEQALHRVALAAEAGFAARVAELVRRLAAPAEGGLPRPEDRAGVEAAWALFARRPEEEWERLVDGARELQAWPFCEKLCHESERAAADKPRRALALARLAVRVARQVAGSAAWGRRLLGFALAHLANALRVAGDLPAAERTLASAWQLWRAGAAVPGPLPESRLLDLEASLHRDRRRFPQALRRLDEALRLEPKGDAAGRLLLKRSYTQKESGDVDGALATLRRAAAVVDGRTDPRLPFGLRFNLATALIEAGRPEQAAALLPEVRALAAKLDLALDLVRVGWLESRLAHAQGRLEEAIAHLEEVQRRFIAHAIPYDTALATLELAALYLEAGRAAEAQDLALHTAALLRQQEVEREELAAWQIFVQAAEQQALTLDLVRGLLRNGGRGE